MTAAKQVRQDVDMPKFVSLHKEKTNARVDQGFGHRGGYGGSLDGAVRFQPAAERDQVGPASGRHGG